MRFEVAEILFIRSPTPEDGEMLSCQQQTRARISVLGRDLQPLFPIQDYETQKSYFLLLTNVFLLEIRARSCSALSVTSRSEDSSTLHSSLQ